MTPTVCEARCLVWPPWHGDAGIGVCEKPRHEDIDRHVGHMTDPGIRTVIEWWDDDRRTFHGDLIMCPGLGISVSGTHVGPCHLPKGHRGECAP